MSIVSYECVRIALVRSAYASSSIVNNRTHDDRFGLCAWKGGLHKQIAHTDGGECMFVHVDRFDEPGFINIAHKQRLNNEH